MIKVLNLSIGLKEKGKTTRVLGGFNIEIPKGCISVLSGESGAGKTLFAKLISGLLPENIDVLEGSICINEKEILIDEINQFTGNSIFYSPQNAKASLNPVLKIQTQFKDLKNYNTFDIVSLMNKMCFCDPDRILNSYPFELSEGECQRIIIMMGIILKPDLFILDEATSSLDCNTRNRVLGVLQDMNKVDKTTILLITHNLSILNREDIIGGQFTVTSKTMNPSD